MPQLLFVCFEKELRVLLRFLHGENLENPCSPVCSGTHVATYQHRNYLHTSYLVASLTNLLNLPDLPFRYLLHAAAYHPPSPRLHCVTYPSIQDISNNKHKTQNNSEKKGTLRVTGNSSFSLKQEFLRFRNKNIGKMALDCDGSKPSELGPTFQASKPAPT